MGQRAKRGSGLASGLIGAGLALLGWWLTGRVQVRRYVVQGPSMEPGLREGDRLVGVAGWYRLRTPRDGEIVVARPRAVEGREVIKRLRVEPGENGPRLLLLGDNEGASTDSRTYGPVAREELRARVLLRYWPDERRGRVR